MTRICLYRLLLLYIQSFLFFCTLLALKNLLSTDLEFEYLKFSDKKRSVRF